MQRLLLARSVHVSPLDLLTVRDGMNSRRRATDAFTRVRPGVYADSAGWTALTPWDRYLVRVHAFARTHPDVIFCHESAAALLGLPIFGEPRDVHIYDPRRRSSRRFGDVCVHTSADVREVDSRDGFRMVSASYTTVDLMRVLPPAFALAVGDALVSPRQGGTTSTTALEEIAASQSNGRGRQQLARLLPMLDPRAESPGESVSRAVIIWSGFETPELQLEFQTDGYTDRVDFAWRSVRALGESDGYEKYQGDGAAARVIAEKRREDRLRRQCDGFTRWDWADAVRVWPLVERLDAIGVPRVYPPRDALLSTLAVHPRSQRPRNHIPRDKHRNG